MCPLLLETLEPHLVQTHAGPVHTATVSGVNMCSLPVASKNLDSWVSSIPSGSYTLSTFSSSEFPEPKGEGFIGEIPFRAVCPKVSHFLHIF